jgi:mannuronan 5-epimerase
MINISIFIILLLVASWLTLSLPLQSPEKKAYSDPCITYNPKGKLITVTCSFASLTYIYKHLHEARILSKEYDGHKDNKIWLLNASLLINKGSTFYINSTDTKWLKIIAGGINTTTTNKIQVKGNLLVDSTKITSWDPATKDYARNLTLLQNQDRLYL